MSKAIDPKCGTDYWAEQRKCDADFQKAMMEAGIPREVSEVPGTDAPRPVLRPTTVGIQSSAGWPA